MKDCHYNMPQARSHPYVSALPFPCRLTQQRGSISKTPRALKMGWRLGTLVTTYMALTFIELPPVMELLCCCLSLDSELCVPGTCFCQNWHLCSCITRCFRKHRDVSLFCYPLSQQSHQFPESA